MGDDNEKTVETTETTETRSTVPETERHREEHRISGPSEIVDEEIVTTKTETTEVEED